MIGPPRRTPSATVDTRVRTAVDRPGQDGARRLRESTVTVATNPQELYQRFDTPLGVSLQPAGVRLRVLTNDVVIRDELAHYFRAYACSEATPHQAVIKIVQATIDPGSGWQDVVRGPDKKVEDSVRQVDGGRLILNRLTGVVMALQPGWALAIGDLRTHLNQGINLVNACFAQIIMRRGHLLLHASGVSQNGRVAALAGPPGAGKSTASLQLVEQGFRFLSHDRVLARREPGRVEAIGYPQMPRVNPGTLLHHSRLCAIVPPCERDALSALSPDELWGLERRRDVDLDEVYGPGTTVLQGELRALVLLRGQLDGGGFRSRQLDSNEALAAVPLYYKDLGVFDLDRRLSVEEAAHQLSVYAGLLRSIDVVEIRGRWDFAALGEVVSELLDR